MKLKNLLPVTLLAVFALAACRPVTSLPEDSSSGTSSSGGTSGGTSVDTSVDTSGDTSADTSSDSSSESSSSSEVVEESALKAIIAGLPLGEVDGAGLTSIYENLADVTLGIQQSAFEGLSGIEPRRLLDPSQGYMESIAGAGAIDGDVVQVAVETELSLAESDGAGGYVLGEAVPDISEVTTVWKDDTSVYMANVVNEDPADDYSFLATAPVADVDVALFKDFVNSGDLAYYGALADAASTAFVVPDDFAEVTLIQKADKFVDSETDDVYLHLVNYTLGSWFGLYSAAAAGYPAGYEDIYIDRGEVWGFEAYINAEGVLDSVYTYYDHFINWTYQDLNWKEGDPVPNDPLTPEEIAALDLVLVGENWAYQYGVMYHEFSSEAPDAVVVPAVDGLRAADASDAAYLFDPVDYGFTL